MFGELDQGVPVTGHLAIVVAVDGTTLGSIALIMPSGRS
jgi:hypothetical protein